MQDFKSTAVLPHIKAYALFSNLTQCLGHTWCNLKMSLTQANKMVSFIRFLSNEQSVYQGNRDSDA